jgi:hypothetical protein
MKREETKSTAIPIKKCGWVNPRRLLWKENEEWNIEKWPFRINTLSKLSVDHFVQTLCVAGR